MFSGKMNEVKFWQYAVSQEQTLNVDDGLGLSTATILADFQFNEGEGTVVTSSVTQDPSKPNCNNLPLKGQLSMYPHHKTQSTAESITSTRIHQQILITIIGSVAAKKRDVAYWWVNPGGAQYSCGAWGDIHVFNTAWPGHTDTGSSITLYAKWAWYRFWYNGDIKVDLYTRQCPTAWVTMSCVDRVRICLLLLGCWFL